MKRIGDSGQPCLTPFIILKDSEYWSSILTLALEVNYRFFINWKYLPLIPKASNLYKILPIGTESYAFFKSRKARYVTMII